MDLINIPLPADLLHCERSSNYEANNFEKKGKSCVGNTGFYWAFRLIFHSYKPRRSLVPATFQKNPLSFLGND